MNLSSSPARLVVAGVASGVGKTTVATGLMAALAAQGLHVQGYKVGPDYIDPTYHRAATGRASYNLDTWLSSPTLVRQRFEAGMRNADVAIIEGVMGLFDGRKQTLGTASTAEVAKLLNAPVLLVLDVSHMGQSAAAIVHGFQHIDPQINIAGVIINRVASVDHEATVRLAIAEWTGVPVLGVLRRDTSLALPARHLGLIPIAETAVEVERLGAVITRAVDLEGIVRIAREAGLLPASPPDACNEEMNVLLGQDPIGADSRVSCAWETGDRKGQYRTINENILPGCLIHQGQHKAPLLLPSPPDPYETSTCCRCPTAEIPTRQGSDQSVGVGGAWEAGGGPCADPGSPQRRFGWDIDTPLCRRGACPLATLAVAGSHPTSCALQFAPLGLDPDGGQRAGTSRYPYVYVSPSTSGPVPIGEKPDEDERSGTSRCPYVSPIVRIGVALDNAFSFYYPETLEAFEQMGVDVVPFSPLADSKLPSDLDLLYFGGGFPEVFAAQLANNQLMLASVRRAAQQGVLIYAECGGYMYLGKRCVDLHHVSHDLAGILPYTFQMGTERAQLGYREVTTLRETIIGPAGTCLRGHEFHWSHIAEPLIEEHVPYQFAGEGITKEGYATKTVLASYVHIPLAANPKAMAELIRRCVEVRPHFY